MKIQAAACLLTTGLFLSLAGPTANADEHNLLSDPGFEGEGAWTLFEVSSVTSDAARSGNQSMLNGAYSRTVSYPPYFVGAVSGAYQELPATPGSRWRLTGFGMTTTAIEGTPAFGVLQVSFFDAEGNDLGTVETAGNEDAKAKLSAEINNQTPAGEWVSLDTGIATAPDGAVAIQAFTLYVDYSGANRSQGVHFDDLRLCQVADGDDSC